MRQRHIWNGRRLFGRRDVYLGEIAGRWHVVMKARRATYAVEFADPGSANDYVAVLTADGGWRDVVQPHRVTPTGVPDTA